MVLGRASCAALTGFLLTESSLYDVRRYCKTCSDDHQFCFHVESWVRENHLYVLMIAVLVGIIPESGPHLVFVTMFAAGVLPVSILLANSIVQDGHGMLPMLAVSRKSFFWIKGINLIVGLAAGVVGLYFC